MSETPPQTTGKVIILRGTLINAGLVAVGAILGWLCRGFLPQSMKEIVMSGLGLVTLGMGIKLFLQGKKMLVTAGAVAFGGIVGTLIGIDNGFRWIGDWAQSNMPGSSGSFSIWLVTVSLIYCVGPLTILGCLEDGIEGNYQLLALKGLLDGIGAIFFAAIGDPLGVFCSAIVILILQGSLTLMARPLQWLAKDSEMMDEISAVGGPLLLAIGFGLLSIKAIPVANFLPALIFAPCMVGMSRRFKRA
jgi:uncharacterized membrane protein YqgA involved in biofilm formation